MTRGFSRGLCVVVALLWGVTIACAQSPAQPRVTIGYVEVAGDPRYEPLMAYGRVVLKSRERPFVGAQIGHEDAQAAARVLKIDFALERISVKSPAEVAAAVVQALASRYGVDPKRLTPRGLGPLAPVASNRTEEGQAKNRRVEMVEQ